jgi:hypothetical protein
MREPMHKSQADLDDLVTVQQALIEHRRVASLMPSAGVRAFSGR